MGRTRFDKGISHSQVKAMLETGKKPSEIAKTLKVGRTGIKRLVARMRTATNENHNL